MGRAGELAQVGDALERAPAGVGAVVFVESAARNLVVALREAYLPAIEAAGAALVDDHKPVDTCWELSRWRTLAACSKLMRSPWSTSEDCSRTGRQHRPVSRSPYATVSDLDE